MKFGQFIYNKNFSEILMKKTHLNLGEKCNKISEKIR